MDAETTTKEPEAAKQETASSPPPATDDFDALLERFTPFLEDPEKRKRLRSHPTIAGIAGDIAQTIAANMRREDTERTQRETTERIEQELMQLAEQDPLAFAEKYRTDKTAAKTQREIADLRESIKREHGERLGKAITGIPEFKELTREDVGRLGAAMTGKTDEEVIEAYTVAALDILAEKRVAKRIAAAIAEAVPKEVAAQLKERNAARLKTEKGPDMRRASSAAASNEPPYDPAVGSDWNKWYENQFKVGRRYATA